jgi:hypothetical protein
VIGYTPQHISEVELAQASASHAFVAACDRALDAGGRLVALYPAVATEHLNIARAGAGPMLRSMMT